MGPEPITARTRVRKVAGAPVIVSAVDFSKIEFFATPGSYSWRGPHGIEVTNVSDRPVTDVFVWVYVGAPNGAMGGKGVRFQGVLPAGARAQVFSKPSRRLGSFNEGEVIVEVVLASARVGDCEYRSSQSPRRSRSSWR